MRWLALCSLATALPLVGVHAADAPKGKIVYSRKDGEQHVLHVMNADGTGDHLLPGQNADQALFPVWSPDGKKIVFMSGPKLEGADFHIQVINADGTGLVTFSGADSMCGVPAWSPDGKQIAYMAGNQEPKVYVADADGSGARKVSPEGVAAICPFWSRDGKRIGFTRAERTATEPKGSLVWLTLGDGAIEEIISEEGKLIIGSANGLSPDGKRLLYTTLETKTKATSVSIRDLENKGDSFLSDVKMDEVRGPSSIPSPGWAPDGKSILVTLPTPKGTGVFRVSEDGTEKTRLTPEGVECFTGSWHADK